MQTAGNSDDCDIVFAWDIAIPNDAFNSSAIQSVVLPQSLQYIGEQAFYNSKLESIEVPFNVLSIGKNAFANTPIRYAKLRSISSNIKID